MQFAIVIHHDDDTSYGVAAPDLPGCFSGGRTAEEAFANAHEAILLHLEGTIADGEAVPEPRPLESHLDNEDYQGGIWGLVDIDLEAIPDRAVRVNITVPARLLATIDRWANLESESRSGFLTKAALEHISARTAQAPSGGSGDAGQ